MGKLGRWGGILLAWGILTGTAAAVPAKAPTVNQSLKALLEGNKRFVEGSCVRPHATPAYRSTQAQAQHPWAVIVSCADSRVPPELLFDEGIGDLFVCRVAGNIVGDVELGSIEYAVEHLKVPLVVVLGHERCGAVEAAVVGGHAHGHIDSLVKAIRPAVERARKIPGDLVDNAVRANVELTVEQLRTSAPLLADRVKKGRLRVVGARYDLDTGRVDLLRELSTR